MTNDELKEIAKLLEKQYIVKPKTPKYWKTTKQIATEIGMQDITRKEILAICQIFHVWNIKKRKSSDGVQFWVA